MKRSFEDVRAAYKAVELKAGVWHPSVSHRVAADELGVSRARAAQLAKQHGIKRSGPIKEQQGPLDDPKTRRRAEKLLETKTVIRVALAIGYEDPSAFRRAWRRYYEDPPSAWRGSSSRAK